VIASLPGHGVLELPDGSRITAVPWTLTGTRHEVVYKPQPDFTGADSFTFYAEDGGTAPTGGRSNIAAVTISIHNRASVVQPTCFWRFEEGTGTIAGDSVGSRHGTVYGARWTVGRVGGALAFDGVDDYVRLPYNDPVWLPQNDFTLAFWVYFDTGDTFQYVPENEMILDLNCAKSSDPANELGISILRVGGSRKIAFQMTMLDDSDEDLYTKAIFDKGRWYHIVAIRRDTQQQIYVNGELDNSRDCSSSPIDYTGAWDDDTVSLGAYSTTVHRAYYLKGKLDEVALFYRGLSAAEIRELYESW
jgi:hypothetical protein